MSNYFQAIQRGVLPQIKSDLSQSKTYPEFLLDKKGRNGLILASKYNHRHLVQYFIEELKFSPYTSSYTYKTVMDYARKYQSQEVIDYFENMYMKFIINDDIYNVKLCREYFQFYEPEYNSIGVLSLACSYGHTEIVQYFLQQGYDVDYIDGEGGFPLIQAAGNGHLDIVRMLIIQNANINLQNDIGMSALDIACEYSDNLPIIRYLLDQGAYINIKNCKKNTPIFTAIECNNPHIVEYLLSRQAEISRFTFYSNGKIIPLPYVNLNNKNVFDYAKPYPEIQKILYKYWLRHATLQMPFVGKKMYKEDPRIVYERRQCLINEIYYVPPLFESHPGGLGYQEAMTNYYECCK